MNVGSLVGLGGILGGTVLLIEFREIGSSGDMVLGAAGIIMLFVGAGIALIASSR